MDFITDLFSGLGWCRLPTHCSGSFTRSRRAFGPDRDFSAGS